MGFLSARTPRSLLAESEMKAESRVRAERDTSRRFAAVCNGTLNCKKKRADGPFSFPYLRRITCVRGWWSFQQLA